MSYNRCNNLDSVTIVFPSHEEAMAKYHELIDAGVHPAGIALSDRVLAVCKNCCEAVNVKVIFPADHS